MAYNLLILIETLAFVYLSFLAGDLLLRLAGRHTFSLPRLRPVYAVMLGAAVFGMSGLLLGLAGLLTPFYLRFFMLLILAISHKTIAAHARILRSHASFLEPISKMALKAKSGEFRRKASAAGAIRTRGTMSPEKEAEQKFADCSPNAFLRWVLILTERARQFFREHGFLKLIILAWLAVNFTLAFVPITAHDTKSYHLPIIAAMAGEGRITFSPEIFEYSWMPLTGEIIYAIPTIAFANTQAPFVFQILQYGAFVLLLIVIHGFLRDTIRFPFLRLSAIIFTLAIFDLQREALHGGYTDIFVYLFGIASAFLLIEGYCRDRIRTPDMVLSAVFLAVALGVKSTAAFIAVTNYLFLIAGMLKHRAGMKKTLAHLATYSLIILVIAGFWYGKNAVVYGNPLYVGGSELYAARMAETFVVEPTASNLLLFPFYKFGPNSLNNSLSSTKFIVLGYFILVYAAAAISILFARQKITWIEALLFAASQIQLILIFFQSHHTRYMLPAIIILPVVLALFADRAHGALDAIFSRSASRAVMRVSHACIAILSVIFFVGNIRYFYVKVLYKTGVLNEMEYIKKIGSQ